MNDTTTNSQTGNSSSIEKYKFHKEGDDAVITTNQYLVREFRELARSIDSEIIEELQILFMGLY